MAVDSRLEPTSVRLEIRGQIAIVTLARPAKRNAIDDATIHALDAIFSAPPSDVRAFVLAGDGDHFCAGLDLSEHRERTPHGAFEHSRAWHRTFEKIATGGLPVVAALQGAVVGGGLEIAAATHVRVADASTFFALPEGQRGIFVGGGGSVRIARLIGAGRMAEMMLTGRRYDASAGLTLGLAHELVAPGATLTRALELAEGIAANAPLSNFAIVTALERIAAMAPNEGFFTESLVAAFVQGTDDARERMSAFLDRGSTS